MPHSMGRINVSAPSFPPSEAAPAGPLSSRRGWGCCPIHKKKRRIFLTVPGNRNFAVPSGLSDERSRRKSLRKEFGPRWQNSGSPGRLEIPRFWDWSPKPPAAPAKEGNSRRPYREKGGQNRGPNTSPKPLTNAPCQTPAEKAGGTGDYVIGRRKLNERFLNCGKKIRVGII